MALDPLTAVTTAVTLGKTLLDAVQGIRKRLDEAKPDELAGIRDSVRTLEAGVLDSQSTILDLKAVVLDLKEEAFNLRQENGELTQQNRELAAQLHECQTGEASKKEYSRVQVGKAWVVVEKGTEEPHFCASCFGVRGELIPLRPLPKRNYAGRTHDCTSCLEQFDLILEG